MRILLDNKGVFELDFASLTKYIGAGSCLEFIPSISTDKKPWHAFCLDEDDAGHMADKFTELCEKGYTHIKAYTIITNKVTDEDIKLIKKKRELYKKQNKA